MSEVIFPDDCDFDVLRRQFGIELTRSEFESMLSENGYGGLACPHCGLISCPNYRLPMDDELEYAALASV